MTYKNLISMEAQIAITIRGYSMMEVRVLNDINILMIIAID